MEEGVSVKSRALVVALLVAATVVVSGSRSPVVAGDADDGVSATLDGKPIPVSEVSRYFCDDFSYPMIRCSRSELVADLRATTVLLLTGIDYVTIFDAPSYGGAWMNVSQDYGTLLTVGWNDKVSSFKGRNSETGRFWTDWFSGGTSWSFCCNTQVPSLGAYDNTFSSVQRT
jgi:hypothetical protein